ncbi:putative DNA relaxase NicK (plasmid) [Bacillus cereus]|nr:putative DNA relaxase NicK [Bacillus cereus]
MGNKQLDPRICNTGVLNTSESGLRACVDWVQATLKIAEVEHVISNILGLKNADFVEQETSKFGYKKMVRFGSIQIYYEGHSEDMGIHIHMGGQACREYEEYQVRTWAQLFALIFGQGHFTRIDIAIDDFKGYFKISAIERKIKTGQLSSKFKKARHMESIEIKEGKSLGRTVYFGSEHSDVQIRMYDKKLEREGKGKEVTEDFWVRTEIQTRDLHADKIARRIIAGGSNVSEVNGEDDNCEMTVGETVKETLANYLRFLVKPKDGGDSNKGRWKTAPFWDKFLGDVEKLKLTDVAPDRTVERSIQWLEKQVAPTLGLVFEAYDNDAVKILQVMREGVERLGSKERAMLNRFRLENPDFVEKLEKKHESIAEQKQKIRKFNEEREQKKKSDSALTPYDFM